MPQGARLNIASEPLGSVDMAIAHARRLLEKNPDLAAEQAREVLNVDPVHPTARLILGAALRRGGRARQALDVLEPLGSELPHAAPVYLELGVARAETGHLPGAIAALRRALQLNPASADGWRFLADYLQADGDEDGAGEARVRYVAVAARDPRLKEAAAALMRNDLPLADRRLRAHLAVYPTDVAALRMLAEVAGRLRKYIEAQELLERCLRLAPEFDAARQNYAAVLNRQAKPAAALPHAERLLAKDAGNPGYLSLKAAILANLGDYRGVDRPLRQGAARPSAATQGVDESRTRFEDGAPSRRERDRVSSRHRDGVDSRRGLLEPREPEDLSLSAQDARAMRRRSIAPISPRRIGCISNSRSARRSRTRGSYETRSPTTRPATRCAAPCIRYSAGRERRS